MNSQNKKSTKGIIYTINFILMVPDTIKSKSLKTKLLQNIKNIHDTLNQGSGETNRKKGNYFLHPINKRKG